MSKQSDWRDREFQRRLLAALEKPKPNRLIAVVNSAVFLWLLSALLVTFGGTYFASHQACIQDGDRAVERWHRLTREISVRHEELLFVVASAKTISSIRDAIPKLPSVYFELRERTLFELTRERSLLSNEVDFSAVRLATVRLPRREPSFDEWRFAPYGQIGLGILERDVKDELLDDGLRDYFVRILEDRKRDWERERYYLLEPRCTPAAIAKSWFGYRPKKIAARASAF